MEDEPQDDPGEKTLEAEALAREKGEKFRMHAELFAVFEGTRKFEAQIRADLDANVARDVQRAMGKIEKSKAVEHPVLLDEAAIKEAKRVLNLAEEKELATNDYYIHRRPGEVMIVRWLYGEEVELFYERLQAHFDAGLAGFKEDERQAKEWKKDPKTAAYLKALDAIEIKMEERYLREVIQRTGAFVLSTQTADELNIAFLADYVMEVPAAEIVGEASAPGDEPAESDLAWFFKLFSLRGVEGKQERMCFFAYLQKTEDTFAVE